nr:unnamed protein product [Rangifer tarandus platyrhynchus]
MQVGVETAGPSPIQAAESLSQAWELILEVALKLQADLVSGQRWTLLAPEVRKCVIQELSVRECASRPKGLSLRQLGALRVFLVPQWPPVVDRGTAVGLRRLPEREAGSATAVGETPPGPGCVGGSQPKGTNPSAPRGNKALACGCEAPTRPGLYFILRANVERVW